MAVRISMADLIALVRDLIGDPAGASAVWTDTQIQRALDARREDVRYGELTPLESIASGGAVTYLTYRSTVGNWEKDAQLVDGSYSALTPTSSDCLVGEWTFAAHQASPVLIVGRTYDVNAAAADILDDWAAKVKLEVDYDNAGLSNTWMHKAGNLLKVAAELRSRQRPRMSFLSGAR